MGSSLPCWRISCRWRGVREEGGSFLQRSSTDNSPDTPMSQHSKKPPCTRAQGGFAVSNGYRSTNGQIRLPTCFFDQWLLNHAGNSNQTLSLFPFCMTAQHIHVPCKNNDSRSLQSYHNTIHRTSKIHEPCSIFHRRILNDGNPGIRMCESHTYRLRPLGDEYTHESGKAKLDPRAHKQQPDKQWQQQI